MEERGVNDRIVGEKLDAVLQMRLGGLGQPAGLLDDAEHQRATDPFVGKGFGRVVFRVERRRDRQRQGADRGIAELKAGDVCADAACRAGRERFSELCLRGLPGALQPVLWHPEANLTRSLLIWPILIRHSAATSHACCG